MSISSNLIKAAVCGTLLFGNIEAPDNTFIEDDKDYQEASISFSKGWGWVAFSTAKAEVCNDPDNTECGSTVDFNGDGDWDFEFFDTWEDTSGDDDDPRDDIGNDDDGGDPPIAPPVISVSQCKKLANAKYELCVLSASKILLRETEICGFVPNINLIIASIPAGDNCLKKAENRYKVNAQTCKVNQSAAILRCGE